MSCIRVLMRFYRNKIWYVSSLLCILVMAVQVIVRYIHIYTYIKTHTYTDTDKYTQHTSSCTHAYTRAHTHTYTHTQTHTYTHKHTPIHTQAHSHTHALTHKHTHTNIYINICIHNYSGYAVYTNLLSYPLCFSFLCCLILVSSFTNPSSQWLLLSCLVLWHVITMSYQLSPWLTWSLCETERDNPWRLWNRL